MQFGPAAPAGAADQARPEAAAPDAAAPLGRERSVADGADVVEVAA